MTAEQFFHQETSEFPTEPEAKPPIEALEQADEPSARDIQAAFQKHIRQEEVALELLLEEVSEEPPDQAAASQVAAAAEPSHTEIVTLSIDEGDPSVAEDTQGEETLKLSHEVDLSSEHRQLMTALAESLGSEDYRHLFVRDPDTGEEIDVLNGGKEACAFYLGSILKEQGLLPCAHPTTESTMRCMEESGWEPDDEERIGNVVVWLPEPYRQYHLGFVVGPGLYVSNSSRYCMPIVHNSMWTDSPPLYYSHSDVTADEMYRDLRFISMSDFWD